MLTSLIHLVSNNRGKACHSRTFVSIYASLPPADGIQTQPTVNKSYDVIIVEY